MPAYGVPQPELETSQAPQTHVTGAVFDRPQEVGIGQSLEGLGDGLMDLATTTAKIQGQQDGAASTVTMGADGKPIVNAPTTPFIMGRAGLAYQQAAEAGALANGQNTVKSNLIDMNAKFQGNPTGFKAASSAYLDAFKANGDPLSTALYNHGSDIATSLYGGQVNEALSRDTQANRNDIISRIGDAKETAIQIAKQPGGLDTPQYANAMKTVTGFYNQLSGNPVFAFSQDQANLELQQFDGLAHGEMIKATADRMFDKSGKAAAQQYLLDNIENNTDLHVSEPARRQLVAQGMAQLEFRSEQQKAAADAGRMTVDGFWNGLKSGDVKPDDPMLALAIQQRQNAADSEGVQRLQAAQRDALERQRQGINSLSNGSMLNTMLNGPGGGTVLQGPLASEQGALAFFQSKGWTAAQSAGIVGNLVHESGGRLNPGAVNPGDGSDGSNSIGIGQWNGDRAKALQAFAATQGKPVTDFGTQLAFVQHELETTESAAGQRLRGAGNVQDATAAFALGYERPQGSQTGDFSQVAGAQNRLDQATRLAGGNASGRPIVASNGARYTMAEVNQNPFLLSAYVDGIAKDHTSQIAAMKGVGEAMIKGFHADQLPAAGTMAMYQQAAQQFPELGEQATQITAAMGGSKIAMQAAQMPDASGQAYIDRVMQLSQGAPLYDQMQAREAKAGWERRVKNLKDDPQGEAVLRGWIPQAPAQLDFNNSDNQRQALIGRDHLTSIINSKETTSNAPVFPTNELAQIKSVAVNGTLDQRTNFLGTMASTLSPQNYQTALRQLKDMPETQAMAVAGNVYKDNPDGARNILQGEELLRKEPKLAPDASALQPAFMASMPFADFKDAQLRDTYMGAARAAYANLSASAGDTTGKLNQDRWNQAVQTATGGIINFRGSNVIAPWYGASEGQFSAAMQSLTPDDFRGAVTSDGTPFDPRALQVRNLGASSPWRLQSAGTSGKYLVFSGDDASRRFLQRDTLDARDPGGPFVLDLSGRRGISETAMPAVLSSPPGVYFQKQQPGALPTPPAKGPLPLAPGMGF